MAHVHPAATIRRHALDFLAVVDDLTQPREVRVFASHVVGWALVFVRDDEKFLTDILAVIRRAVERNDEPPLLLLHALGSTIGFDRNVHAGVVRLGERALDLSRTTALARITRALAGLHRPVTGNDRMGAPTRWIRALVGTSLPADADAEVLMAVAAWLRDDGSDIEAIRDLVPDPEAWIKLDIERM